MFRNYSTAAVLLLAGTCASAATFNVTKTADTNDGTCGTDCSLREAVRATDVPCRIGGDEFAVILPESSARDAEGLYRRVHGSIRGAALAGDEERLRMSAGIAELQHGDTAASLFERADAALYRAKGGGKDRVDVARTGDELASEG